MSSKRHLEPAALLLARFGGPTAVANALSSVTGHAYNRSTVAAWADRNRLPGDVLKDLIRAAVHARVPLTHQELIEGGTHDA
ncbi:hypothetical protein CEK28_08550 [Xenophilus sp. AP218F]|nr:hypothetical protein CEK28_08550 [Xenophilus sp. AP218F]